MVLMGQMMVMMESDADDGTSDAHDGTSDAHDGKNDNEAGKTMKEKKIWKTVGDNGETMPRN